MGRYKGKTPSRGLKNYRRLKELMMKEQGGRCFYCGTVLDKSAHMDHIIAKSRGGKDERHNFCLACPRCNSLKAQYSWKRWRDKLQRWDWRRERYVYWRMWDDSEREFAVARLTQLVEEKRPKRKPQQPKRSTWRYVPDANSE